MKCEKKDCKHRAKWCVKDVSKHVQLGAYACGVHLPHFMDVLEAIRPGTRWVTCSSS